MGAGGWVPRAPLTLTTGCVCVGGGLYVGVSVCYHDKTKTPDHSDLRIGIVVDLDTMSQSIDFGFKFQREQGHHFGLLAPDAT